MRDRVFMIFALQVSDDVVSDVVPAGTGFTMLRRNLVLTAAHVAKACLPKIPIVVDTSGNELRYPSVKDVVFHPDADVAALIVERDDGDCLRPAKREKDYYLGDEVLSYGFPMLGTEKPIPGRLMKGHIQRIFHHRGFTHGEEYAYEAYELAFPAFPGQSGAPVILDNLRVTSPRRHAVGIVTRSASYSSGRGGAPDAEGHWAIGASLDAISDWLQGL